MANVRAGVLLGHMRRFLQGRHGTGTTDGECLELFRHGDEAAFAALVARHGPHVWGVCRRVLGHEQDTEDAFQATFLVLARRAASIRNAAAGTDSGRGKPLDLECDGHVALYVGDIDGTGVPALLVGQYHEGRLGIYHNRGSRTRPRFDSFSWFEAGGKVVTAPASG
jgi:hypothetical protein